MQRCVHYYCHATHNVPLFYAQIKDYKLLQ